MSTRQTNGRVPHPRLHHQEAGSRPLPTRRANAPALLEQGDGASGPQLLSHLKLRTEDGEVIEGPDVTKQQIDEFRASGKNPTWYAEIDWVLRTYGPRSKERRTPDAQDEARRDRDAEEASDSSDSSIIAMLQSEIHELRRDKDRLYAELTIKNEQIKEANARTRESNTLMQELQKMLGSWQEQAFRTLPARTQSSEPDVVDAPTAVDAQGELPAAAAASRTTRRSKTSAKKRATPSEKPKWYETPTLKRMFSRPSR